MKTIKILLFLPLLTSAYNLASDNPIIYEAPSAAQNGENQAHGSYFGYNVLLYWSESSNKVWLIVGAPKANYTTQPNHGNEIPVEPGAAYRCSLNGTCENINIRKSEDDMGFIKQIGLHVLIEKAYSWFGAAMSLNEFGALTICAPRSNVRIYNSPTARYHNSMHGVCYEGNIDDNYLDIEDTNFPNFDFSSAFWKNPMNGFAVHYLSPKIPRKDYTNDSVIGAPNHELYGTVHSIRRKKPAELPIGDELPIDDELPRFGYALSSGYYFNATELMIAAGAPGWQYVGQVGIMDPRTDPISIIATVEGQEVGEYFGASLATGDINRDGLNDLIVGAPHWKNDNGRVHIFLGNNAGFFEADLMIEGAVDDGLFGYAVTAGDLDHDGLADIIISAPWEESGVIYVYNGDSKITSDKEGGIRSMVPSQRIAANTIRPDLLRFGFSLSNPVDMDRNGFLDIAVGAYASGHSVILLSRPVKLFDAEIDVQERVPLSRNATEVNFVFALISRLLGLLLRGPGNRCIINVTVDEDYNRIENPRRGVVLGPQLSIMGHKDLQRFKLKKDIRNYVDPIEIVMIIRFYNCQEKKLSLNTDGEIGDLCPIAVKGVPSQTFRKKFPFAIGCGTDDTCNAMIWGTLEFQDIRNSSWIIGSNDLRLVLVIGNYAEMAYRTRIDFRIPKKISLKSILPSCQEESDVDGLLVKCNIGNLAKTMEKRISLDFDMSRIRKASADGTDLVFHISSVRTDSVNRGATNFSASVHLKADVSIALSGKAESDSYRFNSNTKPTNVSLRHTYQVSSFGVTPVSGARLSIRIPRKLGDLEYLRIHHKPQVYLLGRYYDCSMSDLSVSKYQIIIDKTFVKNNIKNEFNLKSTVKHSWNRWSYSENIPAKSDAISHGILENVNESESHKNLLSKFYKNTDAANADIIYLNCSTPNVTCGLISCNIPELRTVQDVARLQLHLVIDNDKLTDDSDDREKVVYFTTDAFVDVPTPSIDYYVPGSRIVTPVTTKFHRTPYANNEISIWVIIGSVLLGLLAQGFLTIFLWKIDFFKRPDKDNLENLQSTEIIPLETNNIYI